MTLFFLITAVVIIAIYRKSKKKPTYHNYTTYSKPKATSKPPQRTRSTYSNVGITEDEMVRHILNNITVTVDHSHKDAHSIIEATNAEEKISYKDSVTSPYQFEYRLGDAFQKKLGLDAAQVKILNNLIDTSNKFNSVPFCAESLIKVLFATIKDLEKHFQSNDTSFKAQVTKVAEIEISKHFRFRKGSNNYNGALKSFDNTIYQALYKLCENSLRDHLGAGRKTDLKWYIYSEQALIEFSQAFGAQAEKDISKHIITLGDPDEASEVLLNDYNKARWKTTLQQIKDQHLDRNPRDFYLKTVDLGARNKNNPAVENIFYEASKVLAKYDKELALKLYVYYIHYDLLSDKIDNKQLAKTIQKSLFPTDEHLSKFEAIVQHLIRTKDLSAALDAVEGLYQTKRRKITLDRSIISSVEDQHAETVELLNKYLKDDEETADVAVEVSETVYLKIDYSDSQKTPLESNLNFSSLQLDTLQFFSKNGFAITDLELEHFAKTNGVFKNSLVEGINELCYDVLDDVLIEEEEDRYAINESYYQKIVLQ